MNTDSAANTGTALRALLTWILVLLVVANVAVWTAWPFRDKLVALGILAPPPIERVDLGTRALPPLVDRADTVSDADQAHEAPVIDRPGSGENDTVEATVPPDTGLPSPSPAAAVRPMSAPTA